MAETLKLRNFQSSASFYDADVPDLDMIKDDEEDKDELYSSHLEKLFSTVFAPELLTKEGRTVILFAWAVMTCCAIYGCSQVEINFNFEFFIPAGTYTGDYLIKDILYYKSGFKVEYIVNNTELQVDFESEETQYQMLQFFDYLDRCYLCTQSWFTQYTLSSWYLKFNSWVRSGNCSLHSDGLGNFEKIVPPNSYYMCLDQWLETDAGRS